MGSGGDIPGVAESIALAVEAVEVGTDKAGRAGPERRGSLRGCSRIWRAVFLTDGQAVHLVEIDARAA